jgi:hypothetical protein
LPNRPLKLAFVLDFPSRLIASLPAPETSEAVKAWPTISMNFIKLASETDFMVIELARAIWALEKPKDTEFVKIELTREQADRIELIELKIVFELPASNMSLRRLATRLDIVEIDPNKPMSFSMSAASWDDMVQAAERARRTS